MLKRLEMFYHDAGNPTCCCEQLTAVTRLIRKYHPEKDRRVATPIFTKLVAQADDVRTQEWLDLSDSLSEFRLLH